MTCADPYSYFLAGMVFGVIGLAAIFVALIGLAVLMANRAARNILG